MNQKMAHAMTILESLPDGWEWSLSKYGRWYHCVIHNDGLVHEPFYTAQNAEDKADVLNVVQHTYKKMREAEYQRTKGTGDAK